LPGWPGRPSGMFGVPEAVLIEVVLSGVVVRSGKGRRQLADLLLRSRGLTL